MSPGKLWEQAQGDSLRDAFPSLGFCGGFCVKKAFSHLEEFAILLRSGGQGSEV